MSNDNEEMNKIERLYILINLREHAQPEYTMYTWLEDNLRYLITKGFVSVMSGHYIITVTGLTYLKTQLDKIEDIL